MRKMVERIQDGDAVAEDGAGADVPRIFQNLHRSSASFLSELAHGFWIEKRYDDVLLRKRDVRPPCPFEVDLHSPGRTLIKEIGREVVVEEADRDQFKDYDVSPTISLMDYESLRFPLKMRNFRPGDRFLPLGGKGTQKLKDFFIDHKVPRFERPGVPLLISEERIAWVVGYRIDERVKITEKTKKVLKVTVV